MDTKVSVLMPVYNAEKYLREAVESVLASDYRDIELICVNDGSTDSSGAILDEYAAADARVRVVNQKNAGASAARNAAAAVATGTYFLPFDSDNVLLPHFIGLAVKILDENENVKVVAPSANFIGDKSGPWKLPEFSLSLLARKNMIDNCAMYRRADFVRVGGYCREIKTREDWALWIDILCDGGDVVRIPELSFLYRVHGTSKRNRNRKYLHEVIDILNRRHPEFFRRHLGGPLRYCRSWSKFINFFARLFGRIS